MKADLGEWKPLRPDEAQACFAGLDVPWWIAGGWAIDLYLERETRPHGDLDVGLLRRDQLAVFGALVGWELFSAHKGRLRRLEPGESLRAEEHGVWCRPGPALPWALELMLNAHRGDAWVYRRDERVTRPLGEILMRTASGVPYLAPEVQLLFKSKGQRSKDRSDLRAVLPRLDAAAREWLAEQIQHADPDHPWLAEF